MAKKGKKISKEVQDKVLDDTEIAQLAAGIAEKQLAITTMDVLKLKIVNGKHSIFRMQQELATLDTKVTSQLAYIKIKENEYKNIVALISKKYNLKSKSWGYNPENGEIIDS